MLSLDGRHGREVPKRKSSTTISSTWLVARKHLSSVQCLILSTQRLGIADGNQRICPMDFSLEFVIVNLPLELGIWVRDEFIGTKRHGFRADYSDHSDFSW